jgi:DNA-binding NarL/FixJ family response regulator
MERSDVLVIDDDRASLTAAAADIAEAGLELYGSTSSGVAGLSLLRRRPRTVVVLPYELPDLSAALFGRAVSEILRRQTPLVVSLDSANPRKACAALDAGAQAVFVREQEPTVMLRAIAEASAGRIYVDPRLRP